MQDGSSPTVAARRNIGKDCERSGSSSPTIKMALTQAPEQSIASSGIQPANSPHLSGWVGKKLSSTGSDKAAEGVSSAVGDAWNVEPEAELIAEAPSAVLGKSEVLGQPLQYTIDVNASGAEHIIVHCERETADSEGE